MRLTKNRSASISYAALAALAFGLLGVLLSYTELDQLLNQTTVNAYTLAAIGAGCLALSALTFSNRLRPRFFWLSMFLASLGITALWPFVLSGALPVLPMLMHFLPAWQLWRLFWQGGSTESAA